MSYTPTLVAGATSRISSTSIAINVTSLTGDSALLNVPSADFLTNGVQFTDVVTLANMTSNNGTFLAGEVLDATNMIIRNPSGGFTTENDASADIDVNSPAHTLAVDDEATPTWTAAQADLGSMWIDRAVSAPTNNAKTCFRHGFLTITLDHAATASSDWISEDEVVICLCSGQTNAMVILPGVNLDGPNSLVRIGALESSDPKSAKNGCVYIGFDPNKGHFINNVPFRHDVHGSFISGHSPLQAASLQKIGPNSIWSVVIWNGGPIVTELPISVGPSQIEGFFHVGTNAGTGDSLVPSSPIQNGTNNIVICRVPTAGVVLDPGGNLGGFDMSDQVTLPLAMFNLGSLSSQVNLQDPIQDFNVASLGRVALAAPSVGVGYPFVNFFQSKTYTFNPKFVISDFTEEKEIPLVGANVRIQQIEDSYVIELAQDPAGNGFDFVLQNAPAGTYEILEDGVVLASFVATGAETYGAVAEALQDAVNLATSDYIACLTMRGNTIIPANIGTLTPPQDTILGIALEKTNPFSDGVITINMPSPAILQNPVISDNSFVTDANGQINSGVGVECFAEISCTRNSPDIADLVTVLTAPAQAHRLNRGRTLTIGRVIVEHPDINRVDQFMVITGKFVNPWPVKLLDLELEAETN